MIREECNLSMESLELVMGVATPPRGMTAISRWLSAATPTGVEIVGFAFQHHFHGGHH